jgi:hypothetical protein
MDRPSFLLLLSGILLGFLVLSADMAHASLIDACVCVVNSAARAAVSLGVSSAAGSVQGLGSLLSGKAEKALQFLQVLSFIVAQFFLVQHVFFVLELA